MRARRGERFTIYCARVETPETALRFKEGERSAAFYWAGDKVAYVVSGPANRERLEKVTKAIYEQMERRRAGSREPVTPGPCADRRASRRATFPSAA